jgi:hypothetical protein
MKPPSEVWTPAPRATVSELPDSRHPPALEQSLVPGLPYCSFLLFSLCIFVYFPVFNLFCLKYLAWFPFFQIRPPQINHLVPIYRPGADQCPCDCAKDQGRRHNHCAESGEMSTCHVQRRHPEFWRLRLYNESTGGVVIKMFPFSMIRVTICFQKITPGSILSCSSLSLRMRLDRLLGDNYPRLFIWQSVKFHVTDDFLFLFLNL